MTDYDLPELPSDDELGITDEDRKNLEEDFPEDRPELSAEEMSALLGDAPAPKEAGVSLKKPKKKRLGWRARRAQRAAEAQAAASESRAKTEAKAGAEA